MTLGNLVVRASDEARIHPAPRHFPKRHRDRCRRRACTIRFRFAPAQAVFFQLELMDATMSPSTSLLRIANGKPEEYSTGQDPVAQPHEVQALPAISSPRASSATKAVLRPPCARNHPEYKLRTRIYAAPPYQSPQDAVRSAVDYILGAGDAWSPTPRRGGHVRRVNASIRRRRYACLPTPATSRSARSSIPSRTATRSYTPATALLEERFYNNPRPFYGFEQQGAVWSRVISAPANVLSRWSPDRHVRNQRLRASPGPHITPPSPNI